MKISLNHTLLIITFLAGCGGGGVDGGGSDSLVTTAIWRFTNYKTCDVKLENKIPFDIIINVNRSDISRYDGFMSNRVWLLKTSGETENIGSDLIDQSRPGQTAVQANGWSKDGSKIILTSYWVEPQHAMLEEARREFIITPSAYRVDIHTLDPKTGASTNLTAVQEVSYYNYGGVSINNGILFNAYIEGKSRIYRMNEDATDKRPLANDSGFAYGLSVSPDGTKYSFHSDYKVYIGDFDTGIVNLVNTPCEFNFAPVWSPDSQNIAFSCGSSNIAPDIYAANRYGESVRFVASRNGYDGSVPFIDGFDYHGGGSDRFVWTADSSGVIHGKNIIGAIELVISKLNGEQIQLTKSSPGSRNVYPQVSPDGEWILFNARRNGSRKQDTYILKLSTMEETQVTNFEDGCNSKINYWR